MIIKRLKKKKLFVQSYRLICPLFDPLKLISAIPGYLFYIKDMYKYSRSKGSEKIRLRNLYPQLHDNTKTTPFESHYFYQDSWAFEKIKKSMVKSHVDVGSNIKFISFLSKITKVTFVDIRPLEVNLKNLISKKGSLLSMPDKDNSVKSISCLHVAEHIGLGRYGDPIDPFGTRKAAKELSRVLAVGGYLYFSLPVGKPRICFNAHRIHSPKQILKYFKDLKLVEFSGVDDSCHFKENIDINSLDDSEYACGLFIFTK